MANKPRGTLTSHFYRKWSVFNIKSAEVSMGNLVFKRFFDLFPQTALALEGFLLGL